jgi:hypothetical protein
MAMCLVKAQGRLRFQGESVRSTLTQSNDKIIFVYILTFRDEESRRDDNSFQA